jgi:hypothetical protein
MRHEPAVRLDEQEVVFCASRDPACHTAKAKAGTMRGQKRVIETISRCEMLDLFVIYPIKFTVSQITCHEALRFQRISLLP